MSRLLASAREKVKSEKLILSIHLYARVVGTGVREGGEQRRGGEEKGEME